LASTNKIDRSALRRLAQQWVRTTK
jgi:hypothetical protein